MLDMGLAIASYRIASEFLENC